MHWLEHVTHVIALSALQIVAKAEFLNPGGSVKDRVALCIVQDAFAQGRLQENGLITEGTAGSTGTSSPSVLLALLHLKTAVREASEITESHLIVCFCSHGLFCVW